jgi:hypothetical protein
MNPLRVGGPFVYPNRCHRCARIYLRRPFKWHRCQPAPRETEAICRCGRDRESCHDCYPPASPSEQARS